MFLPFRRLACRWRVLRDHDAFPGQDLGKVPISQLSDAKAGNKIKVLDRGRWICKISGTVMRKLEIWWDELTESSGLTIVEFWQIGKANQKISSRA